jgi:hypothetical protein
MQHRRRRLYSLILPTLFFGFAVAPIRQEPAQATDVQPFGGAGGTYFRAECPTGAYLIGLAGRTGEWIDRVAPICAPWLRGSQTLGAAATGPSFGTSGGGKESSAICRSVTGQTFAVELWYVETLKSHNRFVQYVGANCRALTLSTDPAPSVFFEFGSKRAGAEERVTPGPYISNRMVKQACPTDEAAVGIHGRAGLFVDAIGLICGALPPPRGTPVTNANPLTKAPPVIPGTRVNPAANAPVPSDDMFTIIRPAAGERVQQGQLIITATPPKVGMTEVTELELRYLDAPANQQFSYPYLTVFSVNTPKLLQGYPVDQLVTNAHPGRWQVRARSSMKAVPGSWSFPVPFQLFSQTQSSPVQQTAPLPSSAVTPPSPGQQTTPSQRRPLP